MPPKKQTTKKAKGTANDATADVPDLAAVEAPENAAPKARRQPEYVFIETPTVMIKKQGGSATDVAADKEFTVFPDLPLEIREMIWDCSRPAIARTFFIHPRVERVLKPRDGAASAKSITQAGKDASGPSTAGENDTATKNDKEMIKTQNGAITTIKPRGASKGVPGNTRLTRSQRATEKKNSANKSTVVPVVLRVSQESRRVGLRTYTLLFHHRNPPINAYVNYQLDEFIFQSLEALIVLQGVTDLDPIIEASKPAQALAEALPASRNEPEKKVQNMIIGSCGIFDKSIYMELLPRFQNLKRVVIDCGYPDPDEDFLLKPFQKAKMIQKFKEEAEKGHYKYSKPEFKFIGHDKLHRNYLD